MGFLPDRSEVVMRYVLERHAAEQPNKECLFFEDGEGWTYREALEEAYRAANRLSEVGIKRGDRVLIFMKNDKGWIRAWWGSTALGAVIVPVNTAYKGKTLRHICQDSLAQLIITTPDLAERLKGLDLDLNIIDPTILANGSSDEPKLDTPIEPWDVHAIMYTSGTTGPAKGVVTPYLSIHMGGPRTSGLTTRDDTFLIDSPLFHGSGLWQSHGTLAVGGRIALRTVFSGSRYWDIVRECGVTVALLFGTMPGFLLARPAQYDDPENPLRKVWCAPMVSDPDGFKARFGIEVLSSGYGMAETCNIFVWKEGNPTKSCGRIDKGFEVRLVDAHDIPVPTGEMGELIIRADLPWVMNAGYWRRPEETAKAWRNGWFHSGDLFCCDDEGNYYFVDRKKDAVRRRGENISSFEVEREVLAYPEVLEAACVAFPAEFGEDEVKVFVVTREDAKFEPAELIKFLIPRMPYFMVPRYVEVVSGFPKTETMRVKKYELRARGNSAETWDREAAGIHVTRKS